MGVSNLGLLAQLGERVEKGGEITAKKIDVFDELSVFGAGIAYSPQLSDPTHLLNFSDEKIMINPHYNFRDFLRDNCAEMLKKADEFYDERLRQKLEKKSPDQSEDLRQHYERIKQSFRKRYNNFIEGRNFYSRFLFGAFASQVIFLQAVEKLRSKGVEVNLHPSTRVAGIEKSGEKFRIKFGDEQEVFCDRCVVAIGRKYIQGDVESEKYIDQIWPVDQARSQLERLRQLHEEDRVFRVAIHGGGAAALDLVKSVFIDDLFEHNASGQLQYRALDARRKIRVDIIMKENSVVRDLRERYKYLPQVSSDFTELYKKEGAPISLIHSFFIEMFKDDFDVHSPKNNFLKFLIDECSPNKGESDLYSVFQTLEGDAANKTFLLKKALKLDFDNVDYAKIFDRFTKNFTSELGDRDCKLIMKKILERYYAALPECRKQESQKDEALFNIYSFFCEKSLQLQTAQELKLLANQGLLGAVVAGAESSFKEVEGKLILSGEHVSHEYDAALNARGFVFSKKMTDGLYHCLLSDEVVGDAVSTLEVRPDEARGQKLIFSCNIGDINSCFDEGAEIALGFYVPGKEFNAARGVAQSLIDRRLGAEI